MAEFHTKLPIVLLEVIDHLITCLNGGGLVITSSDWSLNHLGESLGWITGLVYYCEKVDLEEVERCSEGIYTYLYIHM